MRCERRKTKFRSIAIVFGIGAAIPLVLACMFPKKAKEFFKKAKNCKDWVMRSHFGTIYSIGIFVELILTSIVFPYLQWGESFEVRSELKSKWERGALIWIWSFPYCSSMEWWGCAYWDWYYEEIYWWYQVWWTDYWNWYRYDETITIILLSVANFGAVMCFIFFIFMMITLRQKRLSGQYAKSKALTDGRTKANKIMQLTSNLPAIIITLHILGFDFNAYAM